MSLLYTTLGPKRRDELGMILPHEHVFVDLRTPDQPGYGEADAADVVRLMAPEIERIKAQGVTALVECSTGGVGVRPDLDLAVSQATGFPIVVPTGNYREPWIPDWVRDASEGQLHEWMLGELNGGFESAPFHAGWIKLSAGDDGITAARDADPPRRDARRGGDRRGDRQPHDQGPRGDGPARYHRGRGRLGRAASFRSTPRRSPTSRSTRRSRRAVPGSSTTTSGATTTTPSPT